MIDWFALRGSVCEQVPAAADGTRRSEMFPGLWLDTSALLRGDLAAVRARFDQGLLTDEHRAFAARLAAGGSVSQDQTP